MCTTCCGGESYVLVITRSLGVLTDPPSLPPPPKSGFIVKRVYENFVEKAVDETLTRCRDDLTALTRFVTWDLHERSAGALRRSLPDSSMVHIYSMAVSFFFLLLRL